MARIARSTPLRSSLVIPTPPEQRRLLMEGANYRIESAIGLIYVRVWKRNDLDSDAGAALSEELSSKLGALAVNGRSLVFDFQNAPEVFGPRTQAAKATLLAAWLAQAARVAFVAGASSLQRLQLLRILGEHPRDRARLMTNVVEAVRWATHGD